MHKRVDSTIAGWSDYELLDSGEHMKLERFGEVVLARPETQAIWKKSFPQKWDGAHATFTFSDGKGKWALTGAPREWDIAWKQAKAKLELTNFKHIGIFPEQAENWEWVHHRIKGSRAKDKGGECKVLNLFGYTGMASVVAVQAGAKVTHVDASKQSIEWGRANMILSGLPEDAIRWILDDALAFVKREVKRGNTYHGIILDPPAFGRGAKGEVWHIEEDLPRLMEEVSHLLAPDGFLLLNGYAAGYTATSFLQLVASHFPDRACEYGELFLQGGDRLISEGIYVRS
jgi:23S rRNA (cytosine1962-C5)-methyltransferase